MSQAATNGWTRLRREALNGSDPRDDQATALRRLMEAAEARSSDQGERRGGRVLAIASGKGGVGKTSVCANLAASLAKRGQRVTLVDADLGLANADVLCGVQVRGHLGHVLAGSRSLDEIAIDTPQGFRLLPGAAGIAALADLPDATLRSLASQLAALDASSDVTLIDCGAGIGRHVLSFLAAADLSVVVTTPEPTAVTDAYALLKVALGKGGPRHAQAVCEAGSLGVLVNQAGDEREARQTHRRIAQVCERFLGATPELVGWVMRDAHVAQAVRDRRLFVEQAPRCHASRGLARVALEVERRLEVESRAARPGFFRRLFGSG